MRGPRGAALVFGLHDGVAHRRLGPVTPDQIKLCVQLAIAAVLLAGAAWAGWAINGWRLGAELERTKGERDLVTSAANACSAGVDLAKKTSEQQ
jgi:hypothetical protein